MTRDEFIGRFGDELTGLLLESFHVAPRQGDFAANGRLIIEQMKRGRALLGKLYDSMQTKPEPPRPPANGAAQPQRKVTT